MTTHAMQPAPFPAPRDAKADAIPSIRPLAEATFDREVLAPGETVLVEFGATWCAPCRALRPVLQALAAERAGQLTVAEVDVDESPSLAARFGVRGVPTLILFAGGKERGRQVGLASRARVAGLVDDAKG